MSSAADVVGHFCKYCGLGSKEDEFLTYEDLERHLNNPDYECYVLYRHTLYKDTEEDQMAFIFPCKPERQRAICNHVHEEIDDDGDVCYYFHPYNDNRLRKVWLCQVCKNEFYTKEELKEHMQKITINEQFLRECH